MKKINQELFIDILDDDPDFAYIIADDREGSGCRKGTGTYSDFPDNAGGGYLAVVI